MSSVAVSALAFSGAAVLTASLIPISSILGMLKAGPLHRSWLALVGLILFFILGYVVFGYVQLGSSLETIDLLVATILFLGACFVVGVAVLSRQTTISILRMVSLERDVVTDELTGLLNRRVLSSTLEGEIERAREQGLPLCVLLIDIDRFKLINDTYGHQAGDHVLRTIGRLISTLSRPSDFVARYGGDEILLIAPDTDLDGGSALAERIREGVANWPLEFTERTFISSTVSIGVAAALDDGMSDLIQRADRELYRAKARGRNRVSASSDGIADRRLPTTSALPPTMEWATGDGQAPRPLARVG